MEIKKSPKANLEKHKGTWLLMGYVIVLAVIFVAFEWTERDVEIDTSESVADLVFEEEIIPITEQKEKPKPPEPKAPVKEEVLKIVEDDAEVEETTIETTEDTGEKVEVKYVPVEVEEEEPQEEEVFVIAETMPSFPGGARALMRYLSKNINYPTIAQENGTQGKVILQFVVNKDGSIVDITIARGVDPYLDKEAIRVVKGMPKWSPGKQRGKTVRVKYTLTVVFKLRN